MNSIHRYEGTVNKVLGDAIMAIFGPPLAHEDHDTLACFAALAMHSHMRAVADGIIRLYERRDEIGGLRFVYEPEKLRFFQGRFEPVDG